MTLSIKAFFLAFILFVVIDYLWIGGLAKSMYLEAYKPWLRLENGVLMPMWWAAIGVYLLFAFAFLVFIMPLAQGSWLHAFYYGAAMGFITYGVYNLTCLAIFKDFPIGVSLIDTLWGTFLCGFSSALALWILLI